MRYVNCEMLLSNGYGWDMRYCGLAGEIELDSLLDMYCCYYLVDIFSLVFSIELCVSDSLEWKLVQLCRATPGWVLLPCCLVLKVDVYLCFPFVLDAALVISISNG